MTCQAKFPSSTHPFLDQIRMHCTNGIDSPVISQAIFSSLGPWVFRAFHRCCNLWTLHLDALVGGRPWFWFHGDWQRIMGIFWWEHHGRWWYFRRIYGIWLMGNTGIQRYIMGIYMMTFFLGGRGQWARVASAFKSSAREFTLPSNIKHSRVRGNPRAKWRVVQGKKQSIKV